MNHEFPVGTPVVAFDEAGTVSQIFTQKAKREQVIVEFASGEIAQCHINQLAHVIAKRPLSDYRWPLALWLKANEPLQIAQTNQLNGETVYRVISLEDSSRGPAEGGGWWLTIRDLNTPQKAGKS